MITILTGSLIMHMYNTNGLGTGFSFHWWVGLFSILTGLASIVYVVVTLRDTQIDKKKVLRSDNI
jgi:hypothetical protein